MQPNTETRIVVMRAIFAGNRPVEEVTVHVNVTCHYYRWLEIGNEDLHTVRRMAVAAYEGVQKIYPEIGYGLAPWTLEVFDRDTIATYFVDDEDIRVERAFYTKYRGCHENKVTTERLEIYDAMLAEYMALMADAR